MDRYISEPSGVTWSRVVERAQDVLEHVREAEEAFRRVNNIYIFEKSHQQFIMTFNERTSYLLKIIHADSPIEPLLFKTYRNAYVELVTTLESLIDSLRAYGREVIHTGFIRRTTMTVVPRPDLKGHTLLVITILAAVASVLFAAFGVWLVSLGSSALGSEIHLFGQTIKTQSVGVACVFIGGVTLVIIMRRVMRSLDLA